MRKRLHLYAYKTFYIFHFCFKRFYGSFWNWEIRHTLIPFNHCIYLACISGMIFYPPRFCGNFRNDPTPPQIRNFFSTYWTFWDMILFARVFYMKVLGVQALYENRMKRRVFWGSHYPVKVWFCLEGAEGSSPAFTISGFRRLKKQPGIILFSAYWLTLQRPNICSRRKSSIDTVSLWSAPRLVKP